jgi:hypothetical protein
MPIARVDCPTQKDPRTRIRLPIAKSLQLDAVVVTLNDSANIPGFIFGYGNTTLLAGAHCYPMLQERFEPQQVYSGRPIHQEG